MDDDATCRTDPGMNDQRVAGVLAHPTSLPGPLGTGDLGPAAVDFLDWIAEAGLRCWQVLPLGPTGPDASPYSSPSAFAGNPMLISPQGLVHAGWLSREALGSAPEFPVGRVDFPAVATWKSEIFRRSWARFSSRATAADRHAFEAFAAHPDQACWLEDWALYAALKERFDGRSWVRWDAELRMRRPAALETAVRELGDEIAYHRFLQFAFHRQWEQLRSEARARDVELIGDLPFYVAPDSADAWAHRELFHLAPDGRPSRIAGVPPDYFSETGQRWGNPVYDWERVERLGYRWWVERLRANLRHVGALRLDHFRGFVAYWEIDATAETAAEGQWMPGPGRRLFDALHEALGELPLIAEDLGVITEDVEALRDELGLPGMHVPQFAFGDTESKHLPEHHRPRSVVYTGTHDNDTLAGWFAGLGSDERERVQAYLACGEREVPWSMIEAAYRSAAGLALVPLQDLLDLGSAARMNRPGTTRGNWSWRAAASDLTPARAARSRGLTEAAGRETPASVSVTGRTDRPSTAPGR